MNLQTSSIVFQENIRKFTRNEIAPLAPVIDREHRFPIETLQKFGELGYMGFPFPNNMADRA